MNETRRGKDEVNIMYMILKLAQTQQVVTNEGKSQFNQLGTTYKEVEKQCEKYEQSKLPW